MRPNLLKGFGAGAPDGCEMQPLTVEKIHTRIPGAA
jgi:hypothetical protein